MEEIYYDGKLIGKLEKIHNKRWLVYSELLGKTSYRAIVEETSRIKAIEEVKSIYKEVFNR
jgi:hypothetical protein